jgi:hypothetical protein
MSIMQTVLVAGCLLLVVAGGIVQGQYSDRWSKLEPADAVRIRLQHVPRTLAGWSSTDAQLSPRQLEIAQAEVCFDRVYNRAGIMGQVRVTVLTGRPGPLAVHTPDVCYTNNGYTALDTPRQLRVGTEQQLWHLRLLPASQGPPLEVLWGWSTDGTWQATRDPRGTFAHVGRLFKVYVVTTADAGPTTPATHDLLQLVMDELQTIFN